MEKDVDGRDKPGHDDKQKRPGLLDRPFIHRYQSLLGESPSPRPSPREERGEEQAQLAFFTYTGLPTFFSIARFSSRARGERLSGLAAFSR